MNPKQFASGIIRNAVVLRIIGIVTVGFFRLCLVFIVKKLFDNKIGLIIDQNGIADNTNAKKCRTN